MKRKRLTAAMGLGVATAALLTATPAGATWRPSRIIEVEPTSGPVGTTVTVSGDNCGGEAYIGLFKGTDWMDGLLLTGGTAEPEKRAWSGEIVVPDHVLFDQNQMVEPGEDYFVGAACVPYNHRPGDVREGLNYKDLADAFKLFKTTHNLRPDFYPYKPVDFEVTEAAEPVPTTTVPGEEEAPPVVSPGVAAPAQPIPGAPDYTG